ncbi:hypothetical protein QRO08_15755 [Paracidovorax citrulli]|uniref:Uncharacterized protein n=2 Tax=Paracidovorax citrulli TaxID=80869 RepID=A1TN31_PARC0|nr:hypothetical protein [Paracidovorax citrulli]ABM32369.1 hypothetical protein Aave_1784 [Paracidovorax citrulli AAC00-1]ATG94611.1 hypothetical protein CQB05_11740 [Paracidovorax citrulli]PVY66584.1 hypothetical protein C8E08_3994 [Paracidovorax citrulli]REG69249.1 hypothetical protein C8E07_2394 [Paracidovorax citrulli]RLJ93804.1 hypothetical protein C8E06_2394 [Paracidovorax citrulli]
MTNITSPPAIDALPPAPLPTDTPADFNSKGFATVAAQVNMVPQINAVAANVFQNATAAQERATAAAGSATTAGTQATNAAAARAGAEAARDTAITQAGNASASATAASASALQVDKRYLGAKASAPTTDNQGAALQAGAVYYNTSTNKVMTWSGSAWVDGISAVAGVSSVNGRSGAVTLSGSDLPTLAPKVSPSFAGIVSYTGALRGNALEMGDLVVDCNHSNYFFQTIFGNAAFSFVNPPASGVRGSFALEVDHRGGVITWPASVKWPANVAPSLTTGRVHLFMFTTRNGGTTWRGAALSNYQP